MADAAVTLPVGRVSARARRAARRHREGARARSTKCARQARVRGGPRDRARSRTARTVARRKRAAGPRHRPHHPRGPDDAELGRPEAQDVLEEHLARSSPSCRSAAASPNRVERRLDDPRRRRRVGGALRAHARGHEGPPDPAHRLSAPRRSRDLPASAAAREQQERDREQHEREQLRPERDTGSSNQNTLR